LATNNLSYRDATPYGLGKGEHDDFRLIKRKRRVHSEAEIWFGGDLSMTSATHIREAMRWRGDEPIDWTSMAAAGLGMAGPLALAAHNGHLNIGLAGAVGSLLMGTGSAGRTIGDLGYNELKILATLAVAAIIVAIISDHGVWSNAAVVLVAGIAALIGGYSLQLSVSTGRFIVFLCITFSAASGHEDAVSIFPLICLNAACTSALIFAFGAVKRSIHEPGPLAEPTDVPSFTLRQKLNRWFGLLCTLKGWQFPLRIVICLGIAVAIATYWPTHRFFWIALTVALVCQRPLEPWPLRTTQRAIGTCIGVVIAAIAITQALPSWALITLLGLLSTFRLGLQKRNYLLFSAFITPVVMLILDAGRPVESNLLFDRLVATIIGSALVILVNQGMVLLVERREAR